jgi:hypothetical protein
MTESEIIEGLKRRDVQAFKELVTGYCEQLTILAYVLSKDRESASTIVDNVLIDVWNKVIQLSEPIYPILQEKVREACAFE